MLTSSEALFNILSTSSLFSIPETQTSPFAIERRGFLKFVGHLLTGGLEDMAGQVTQAVARELADQALVRFYFEPLVTALSRVWIDVDTAGYLAALKILAKYFKRPSGSVEKTQSRIEMLAALDSNSDKKSIPSISEI